MKIVLKMHGEMKEVKEIVKQLSQDVRDLTRAQIRTEGKVDRLIDIMLRQNTNGRRRTGR